MDAIKVNTPEELHQAIGEFLQSDYSRENLIMVYDDARKSANRFRVTYSALPKVPTYNNDPLDGLQEIGEWCDKSVKLVDDIVSDLNQQTINETVRQLKKLKGFADSTLSLVDTKLKEQAQKEARAKVEKEYKKLNDEASKTKGMLLLQREEVVMKLELEAQAILRRETEDGVQIYLSKDPTFENRISQQDNEINKVLERLNKLIDGDTPTGKLLDIYCKLKSIPLQRQFDDVGYAYSQIDDWADVISGGCNRLYTSIDNVIKTFEEIKTKAKLKTNETHPQKKPTVSSETRTDKCIKKIKDYPVLSLIIVIGIIIIALGAVAGGLDNILNFWNKNKITHSPTASTNIFADVSKDGSILRSKNFPWKITKTKYRNGNILYTIVDRRGDPTAISVVPDNSTNEYFVRDSWDGLVIEFTCAEEEISNFTIKLKY